MMSFPRMAAKANTECGSPKQEMGAWQFSFNDEIVSA
jgi:hypothetical protein